MKVAFGAFGLVALHGYLAAQTATATGRVVDSSGAPMARAEVLATFGDFGERTSGAAASTDNAGQFRIEGIIPGEVSVGAQAPGFRSAIFRGKIGRNEVLQVPDLVLQLCDDPYSAPAMPFTAASEPGPPLIRFLHADATELSGALEQHGGYSIAEATVRLESSERSYTAAATGGKLEVSAAEPGFYTLTVSASGFADFVIPEVEIKPMSQTLLLGRLPMDRCPDGIQCRPTTRIERRLYCH